MRKILLNLAVSLDGYIEGPNGEFDWCFTDQDYGMKAFLDSVDAIFFGRKSYELMLTMEGDQFPHQKKYVFSNTLQSVQEGWTLVKGHLESEVHEIIQEEGKDIWMFGGASLIASFMQFDLIDELMLAVHPILLGSGKFLYPELPERKHLTLLKAKEYSSGLVHLIYDLKRRDLSDLLK